MVGTAEKNVGRSRSTWSKKVAGENWPTMLTRPPTRSGPRTLTIRALTWNSGRMSRQWSSAVSRICSAMIDDIAATLA